MSGRTRLRSDLYCVGRGVKLYSLTHSSGRIAGTCPLWKYWGCWL